MASGETDPMLVAAVRPGVRTRCGQRIHCRVRRIVGPAIMSFTSLNQVHGAILAAGLEEHAAAIISMARPCVRVISSVVEQSALGPLDSCIGGDPHLPDGFEWPTGRNGPLAHLATIRLSEASRHDRSGLLPKRGLLLFWSDPIEQLPGLEPTDDDWVCVDYLADESTPLRPRPHPGRHRLPAQNLAGGLSLLRPCKVDFEPGVTLPDEEWIDLYLPELHHVARLEKYLDVRLATSGPLYHQMLGHARAIQSPMEPRCEVISHAIDRGDWSKVRMPSLEPAVEPSRWRLLLQLDTDELGSGAVWGLDGMLFFWIPQERLLQADFSRFWVMLQFG